MSALASAIALTRAVAREPISDADQAIAFLMGLVRSDPRPYQARAALDALPVRALLERVGNPHAELAVTHVAGSKGKGTTALYLEGILEAAGRRTGTYTSPHLERWTERFRVAGRESTPAQFAALIEALRPHVRDLREQDAERAPSFFDVLTAAAFLHFAEQRVDVAIMETGIGGTLDATNVAHPVVSCITSVELEHTDKLGPDIATIAAHKAGIIKPGIPVVIGRLPAEAESIVAERAAALGAPLRVLGRDIDVEFRADAHARLSIRLAGVETIYRARLAHGVPRRIAENAALAVACAEHVAAADPAGLAQAVARALPSVGLPGRMEVLAERPFVVVDGAHTPESMRALADMLSRIPARKTHLLVSLSAARDAATLLAPLRERAHRVVVTRADALRSMDAQRLVSSLVGAGWDASRVRAIDDPHQAVIECRAALARHDLLCVTGSMYMAGLARALVLADGDARRAAP